MSTQGMTIAEIDKAKKIKDAPLEILNTEEKRARYRILREKLGRSKLSVEGEPGVHYFWADKSDENDMSRLDSLGYSIVREEDPEAVLKGTKKAKVKANGLRRDGTYVVGDVILTQCEQEVYDFLMLANSERHEDLARGAQRDFREAAERSGVPTFEHNPK